MNAEMCCEVIMTIWEGTWDYVGFWQIAKTARRFSENTGGCEQEIAMEMIRVLLQDGHMEAGEMDPDADLLDPDNLIAWESSVDESLARIEREWEQLEHDPVPSDVCWFATTDKGDKLLEKYNLNEEPFQ